MLTVQGTVFSEFGLAGFLPVYVAPSVLVPSPQVFVDGRRAEQALLPGLAKPCGYDRHRKRDLVMSKNLAQGHESLTRGPDAVGSKEK